MTIEEVHAERHDPEVTNRIDNKPQFTIEEENAMKLLAVVSIIASACMFANPVLAGGPKASHPCYEVADCKTNTSRQEFSACVKAHKAEADANAACAEFRKDKQAYMEKHGIAGLEALFD